MADEIEARNDTDPAAQVARDLRQRLAGLPHDELVELAAQLVSTYVVEGVLPLSRAGESTELAADTVGDETFAQLLKRLKAQKRDPVLEKFLIDGENIAVRIDGYGILPVSDYRRPGTPAASPAAAPPRRETVPGASTNPYNRALYAEEAARAASPPQQPAPAREQPRGTAPQPAAAQRPAQQPAQTAKKEENKPDRFNLIELD